MTFNRSPILLPSSEDTLSLNEILEIFLKLFLICMAGGGDFRGGDMRRLSRFLRAESLPRSLRNCVTCVISLEEGREDLSRQMDCPVAGRASWSGSGVPVGGVLGVRDMIRFATVSVDVSALNTFCIVIIVSNT